MSKTKGTSKRIIVTSVTLLMFLITVCGLAYITPGQRQVQAATSDAQMIEMAKAALSAAAPLEPVQGSDTNIASLAQKIVNAKTSGVTVRLAVTYNPQISSTGTITYASSPRSNSVRFSLTKNSVSATQTVMVTVPASGSTSTTPSSEPTPTITDAQMIEMAEVGFCHWAIKGAFL